MSIIYKNDIGTELILDCGVDVSTATVRKVRVRNPFGGVKEFSAVANTSNTIKYVLVDGDFNVAGNWQVQAYIEMPGWKGRGEWATVEVKD